MLRFFVSIQYLSMIVTILIFVHHELFLLAAIFAISCVNRTVNVRQNFVQNVDSSQNH